MPPVLLRRPSCTPVAQRQADLGSVWKLTEASDVMVGNVDSGCDLHRPTGCGGVVGVAALLRVMVAAVLLGSALLFVALVGQGVALARPGPADAHPATPPNLSGSARSGAADHDPVAAFVDAVADSSRVLDPAAGPVRPTGSPVGVATAGGSTESGGGPQEQDSSEITPRYAHADPRRRVLLAHAPTVADDSGGNDFGQAGEPAGSGSSDTALTVARATHTPAAPKATRTSPAAPQSVDHVLAPVVREAGTLATEARMRAGAAASKSLGKGSRPVVDSADAATNLERQGKVTEAHAQMDTTIERFDALIAGVRQTADVMERPSQRLGKAAAEVKQSLESMSLLEAYGVHLANRANRQAEKLMESMEEIAPDEIDAEIKEQAGEVAGEVKTAKKYRDQVYEETEQSLKEYHSLWSFQKSPRGVEGIHAWKDHKLEQNPHGHHAHADALKLVGLVERKATRMGAPARQLRGLADEAAQVSATAKDQAKLLKAGGTPAPDRGGELLDEPSEEAKTVREAAVGVVEPENPAGDQRAVAAATASTDTMTTPAAPEVVSVDADTTGSHGVNGSGPGSDASVSTDPFDSGFFGGSLDA
jgi:hypothetical protein